MVLRDVVTRLLDRAGLTVTQRCPDCEAGRKGVEQLTTEFLSNVSHELRTPLTPIQGFSEILARRPDLGPEKVQRYAKVVHESAVRLSRTLDLLVDVACLDAGRVEPVAKPVDLADLVARRIVDWRDRNPDRAEDLQPGTTHGLPLAWIDEAWLTKAVDQLVDNALKFSSAGQLVVLSTAVDPPSGLLEISVHDSGIGLDAAARAALLRDFEQGDGSATREREGVGLGLSLVARVVALTGMQLEIHEPSPDGATFALLVPPCVPTQRPAVIDLANLSTHQAADPSRRR